MLDTPHRVSLVAQTVAILRDYIAERPAGAKLPGERELARRMNVSRNTLRAALQKLERERVLHGSERRSRTIARSGNRPRRVARQCDINLLSPVQPSRMEPGTLLWVDTLRQLLAEMGHRLEFFCQPRCYSARPGRTLEQLMDANPGPAVWILLLSTAALQRAFAKSAQPVLVAGSLYEDVRLPAWDIDHAAACRHAVGRFLAKGHRRIALVTGRQPLGGGLRSETGFREAIAAAGGDVEGMVTYYAEHVEGLCTALDRLLVRPRPPTAFLVCRPGYTLAAHGYLIRRGLRFPETAALIGRDHDWHLNYAIPSIAHYRVFPKVEAGAINRLLLDLIAGGNPPARQHLLIPEFVPGDTLG